MFQVLQRSYYNIKPKGQKQIETKEQDVLVPGFTKKLWVIYNRRNKSWLKLKNRMCMFQILQISYSNTEPKVQKLEFNKDFGTRYLEINRKSDQEKHRETRSICELQH